MKRIAVDDENNAAMRHGYSRGAGVGFVWGWIAGLIFSMAVFLACKAWEMYPN